MTDIATVLKDFFAAIAKVLGRNLTSTEKSKIQNDLGIKESVKFPVMYYVNPENTPIDKVDFAGLKKLGITDLLIRTTNTGTAGIIYTKLPDWKKKTDAAGLRIHAWVWDGFKYAKQVAGMKIGVHIDMETYDMANKLSQIKQMRADTKGQTFGVCCKPDGWDGSQLYEKICPYVDYIAPMLYTGDYGKSNTDMVNAIKGYQKKCSAKIIAALETYKSDKNTGAKDISVLNAEIAAVKTVSNGVALFRLGLSNYGQTNPTQTDCYTVKSYKMEKQDNDYNCGPSSSVMALSELGITVTEAEMAKYELTGTAGTGPNELIAGIVAAGKKHGVTLKCYKGSFASWGIEKTCEFLKDPKVAVIAHGMTDGWKSYYAGSYGHYVYPVQYCKSTKTWTIADPDRGVIKYTHAEFIKGIQMISEANQVIVIKKT